MLSVGLLPILSIVYKRSVALLILSVGTPPKSNLMSISLSRCVLSVPFAHNLFSVPKFKLELGPDWMYVSSTAVKVETRIEDC